MKIKSLVIPFFLLIISCSENHKKYVTIKLQTSWPVDTIDNLLITDANSDLSNIKEENIFITLLTPNRRYLNKIPQSDSGYFFIDSVETKQYLYFIIETKYGLGVSYQNDFRNPESDTIEKSISLFSNDTPRP